MSKPRLLDLFCCAGGATRGYQLAGFYVVGVDIKPQPHYVGDEFYQADALEFVAAHGHEFDAIHASPPCQMYSKTKVWAKDKPMLIEKTRAALIATGKPYVIENVSGAARVMRSSAMLCGLMFGLKVFRHRYFESSVLLLSSPHPRHDGHRIGIGGMCSVVGSGDANWHNGQHVPADHRTRAAFNAAMGIDWMLKREIVESIPPAYTEYLGRQLLAYVQERAS